MPCWLVPELLYTEKAMGNNSSLECTKKTWTQSTGTEYVQYSRIAPWGRSESAILGFDSEYMDKASVAGRLY